MQVWQAEEDGDTGLCVNLSLSHFSPFSVLSSRGWELQRGSETRRAREQGWGGAGHSLPCVHSPGCALLGQLHLLQEAAGTKGNSEFGEEQGCAPQNSPQHARDAQGFTERPGCPYPSESVSLKINLLRSALITGVQSFD